MIRMRSRPTAYFLLGLVCAGAALSGCGKGVNRLAQSFVSLTDRHESLYRQMLDCEERYADILATTTDLESINQAQPEMSAEAKKYHDLAKEFLATEGLTPDKLRGIFERSRERQSEVNARIKEQMQRLIGDRSNPEISLAIPHLEWFKYKIDFVTDAEEVANGRKTHLEQLHDRVNARRPPPEQVAKQRIDEAKAKFEESRARMEAMRAKMGMPPIPGPRGGPPAAPGAPQP